MLLKSSDFISHDVTPDMVFDGCIPSNTDVPYKLELILRKWYHFDTSREFRCFVRKNRLIGWSKFTYIHTIEADEDLFSNFAA